MKSFLFIAIVLLAGCTGSETSQGFGKNPVPNHELTVYTCTGAKQTFADFRPNLTGVEIFPRAVTVIDVGTNWVATWEGGKLESGVLYKDAVNRVDGSVTQLDGTRFYRINNGLGATPTFSYSKVSNLTGSGFGYTFFRCSEGVFDNSPIPVTIAPVDE